MAIRVRVWLAAAASRHPVPSAQRPPAERHDLFAVPEQRIGARQPVGDHRGQRPAVRIVPCLGQCLAEPPFRLGELTRGERHRAQHAAA
jgi:hypothetical protein